MAKKTPLSKAQRQDNAPKVAKAEPNSREKAIHSKGTRYVLNLAAILCAVVVVELVLSFALPASFFHDSQKLMIRLGWDSAFFWNQWNHINAVSESTFNSSLDSFQLKEGDSFGLSGLLFNLTWNF